ncbi:MAG: serpin family protein [Clostridia bacterium]|nr:serpin family protein [Clostridia bacterium]
MKKSLAILLTVCLLLGAFCSCAGNEAQSGSSEAQSGSSESSSLGTQDTEKKPADTQGGDEESSSLGGEESSSTTEPPLKQLDDSVVDLMSGISSNLLTQDRVIDEEFILSQMNFSLDLFKGSVKKSVNENVFISPLSVQIALAMNANGANGQTRSEMESVLANGISLEDLNEYLSTYTSNLPSSENAKLEIANSIWFRDRNGFEVKRDFLQKNANYFRAEIYKAKFDDSTVNSINDWVDKNTDSMIKEILKEIPPDAMMYLINAIVFDAEWQNQFYEDAVYDAEFTNIFGDKKSVEMMYRNSEYMYIEADNATGFKKNYSGGGYGFVALLPNEDVSINDYIASLDESALLDTLKGIRASGEGIIKIPKFELEYTLNMNELLSELGMSSAFGESADFSGISNESLYISQVLHKTFISLDNLGTRAGAVTMIENKAESESKIAWTVTLDRPFVYMIVDNATNLPIFIGAVMDI